MIAAVKYKTKPRRKSDRYVKHESQVATICRRCVWGGALLLILIVFHPKLQHRTIRPAGVFRGRCLLNVGPALDLVGLAFVVSMIALVLHSRMGPGDRKSTARAPVAPAAAPENLGAVDLCGLPSGDPGRRARES